MDTELQRWVVEHRVGALDPLFELVTYAGSFGIVWLVLAALLSGTTWRRYLVGPPWLFLQVAAATLVAEAVSGLIKGVVDRDRPPLESPTPEPLVALPATHSFPSGHATVAFSCATVIALAAPRVRVPVLVLAALVAFSRVYVGVHYPLDVVAGALLGVGLGLAVRAAVLRVRFG